MVQLPLPKEFLQGRDEKELLKFIDSQKDVDGLNYAHKPSTFVPAAVKAVISVLEDENISVENKKVVVVGASDLVGKPVSEELKKMGAEVTVIDSKTEDVKEKTLEADILISATGVPGLITGEMVKVGVIVIDVGAEKVDGKVVGDVDFESVEPKASRITPVPGGVGPMTVISLMENVVEAIRKSD
jgi:methylenetetrahydrofolate dehydrogenase (NADP+)/methenyltetrahydrofolate cyclohydrolase